MNIFSNKKDHKSTYSSIVNVSSKKNIEITPTVIDNQHKNLNIPSDDINIPSSKFQLPHYKPNKYYSFNNDQIKRKLILKIYTGNNKESKNLVLHKIKWKSFYDVKKYMGRLFFEPIMGHSVSSQKGCEDDRLSICPFTRLFSIVFAVYLCSFSF